MTSLPTELIDSPLLIEFVDQLQRRLVVEKQARETFRKQADNGLREEFINGEVVTHVSSKDAHTVCVGYLEQLIATFVRLRRLGQVRREHALTAFPRNDYCPDLCFWIPEAKVGLDPNQSIYPPPQFVVEVLSKSTEARDRGVKFKDYEAHGVREYWIVDPENKVIEQYVDDGGTYRLAGSFASGTVTSTVIPGLSIPVAAAFDDVAQLAALQALLKTS